MSDRYAQLFEPAEFGNLQEKLWSERDPVNKTFVPADRTVSAVPGFYELSGGVSVTVNEAGPVVKRRQCAAVDFDCNFWDGDPILVARDPSPMSDASEAPIRLRFSKGVRSVGAWVAVSPDDPTDGDFLDQPLFGYMWVRLASERGSWRNFIVGQGTTGVSLGRNAILTAPFVGARALGNDRIVEVRFDAGLMGNRTYSRLAISELSYEL